MGSDPGNTIEVRNYMLGLYNRSNARSLDLAYGEVRGAVDCEEVNPSFWRSGDPVTDVGWICNQIEI